VFYCNLTPIKSAFYLFYTIYQSYVIYVFYQFYCFFTYFTNILQILLSYFMTPCNFYSLKAQTGGQKLAWMSICFVYNCITWFNRPSVWLQSLIIRTIKCNVQVIIILKCWDFSWNKIILILWAVKDIKDWKQGWHVTDRKKNKLKMRAMLASGLKRSKKDRSRYFVRSFCPTVSVLKRKKKKEGKLTFWRDFEQNKDRRKRKDWMKKN